MATDASALLKTIQDTTASVENGKFTEVERKGLYSASETLRKKLQSPLEFGMDKLFKVSESAVIRIAIDLKLFDIAAEAERGVVTVELLASKSGAERLLVARIARYLAAIEMFNEIDKDTYSSTTLSNAFTSKSPLSAAVVHFTIHNRQTVALPDYFEEKGYQNPGDVFNGPFQYAHNTTETSFEWMAKRPKAQAAFNTTMTLARMNERTKWFDVFPVESKLAVSSPDQVALVDIGGGVGHDLISLKTAHPNLQGKLVLQDLPVVVADAKLPDGIEAVPMDFLKQTPVKGAKGYILRNTLHDWPDKQANMILGNVKESMASDSLLLVSESVVPETNVPLYNCAADINLMAGFAALDRTEKQFTELLENNGFEVVKVWYPEDGTSGASAVFEAIKK